MRKHATCPHSRIIRHQTPNYGRLGPLRLDFFLSPDHIAGLDVAQGRGLNPIDRRLSDCGIIEITSTSSDWGSSGLPDPWASPRPRKSAVTSWIPPEPVVIIMGLGRIDGDGFGGYPAASSAHPLSFTTEPETKRKQTNIHFGNTLSGYLWLFGCLFDIWHVWYPQMKNSSSINLLWIRSA